MSFDTLMFWSDSELAELQASTVKGPLGLHSWEQLQSLLMTLLQKSSVARTSSETTAKLLCHWCRCVQNPASQTNSLILSRRRGLMCSKPPRLLDFSLWTGTLWSGTTAWAH